MCVACRAEVCTSFVCLLSVGDAIFTLSLNYNAIKNILMNVCERTGAEYIVQNVALPLVSGQALVDQVRAVSWRV